MMNRKNYQQVINMNETTTFETETDLQAVIVLSHLGNPSRQLFSDYYQESGKSSPAPLIGNYLSDHGVSSMGLRMGLQMRDLLLEGLRASKHKSAMLGAVGQAHLDLCMAVSIAEYCKSDCSKDLPYSEYITLAKKSVNQLCLDVEQIQSFFKSFKTSYCTGTIKTLAESVNIDDSQRETAQRRIDTALNIVLLWNKSQIEYDESYTEIEKMVKEKAEESIEIEKSLVVLPYILTVQRNKEEFTQEEIATSNVLFLQCSDKSVLAFKKNIETRTIEETKNYLNRSFGKNIKSKVEQLVKELEVQQAKDKAKSEKQKSEQELKNKIKEEKELTYQNKISNWVKENSAYLAIGYNIIQNNNADSLIGEEPLDFLKSLIRDVSREIDLSKLDCPEQIDNKFSSWCISTTMPKRIL